MYCTDTIYSWKPSSISRALYVKKLNKYLNDTAHAKMKSRLVNALCLKTMTINECQLLQVLEKYVYIFQKCHSKKICLYITCHNIHLKGVSSRMIYIFSFLCCCLEIGIYFFNEKRSIKQKFYNVRITLSIYRKTNNIVIVTHTSNKTCNSYFCYKNW